MEVFARRKALDGLRGILSSLVVLFHLKVPLFTQGYAGVDAFFVVSGFVITSIIVYEVLANEALDFYRFYARRAKRLLPGSLFVLIITSILYKWIAAPLLVEQNKASFLNGASYSENVYLIIRSKDYFAASINESPVMHYWSLAVEEQFYLVWPVVLVISLKLSGNKLPGVITPLILIIIILIITGTTNNVQTFVKYLGTPYRIYQLLCGALISLYFINNAENHLFPYKSIIGDVLCGIGVLGIIGISLSLTDYISTTVGMIATGFCCLVIIGLELNPHGNTAKILESEPLLWLGKYSYGIYLWHYPVIILSVLSGLANYNILCDFGMIGVVLVLAWLTWIFVESPMKSFPLSDKQAVAGAGISTLITLCILWIILSQGLIVSLNTLPNSQLEPSSTFFTDFTLAGEDAYEAASILPENTRIPLLQSGDTLIVHGDSYAAEWQFVTGKLAEIRNITLFSHMQFGCPWMNVSLYKQEIQTEVDCWSLQNIFPMVPRWNPQVIFLYCYSILAYSARERFSDGPWLKPGDEGWLEVVENGIRDLLEPMKSQSTFVVLVEPHLIPGGTQQNVCLSKNPPDSSVCDLPAQIEPGGLEFRGLLRKIASESDNFLVISLDEFICPNNFCKTVVDNIPQFQDDIHISLEYAQLMSAKFEAVLKRFHIIN
jgi:peptidoglycan/LPS O-acetylase OafA/YrhL